MSPYRNTMCFIYHYHGQIHRTCRLYPALIFLSLWSYVQDLYLTLFGFFYHLIILLWGLFTIDALGYNPQTIQFFDLISH